MRAYKTVGDVYIEPISFTVPRRAETFQADIFPPAIGTKPACSAKEWLNGKTGIPSKIDFESIYEGGAPKEVPSDFKPSPVSSPAPAKSEPKREEPKKEEPKPAPVSRAPAPTMNEQKGSISALANKFQDNEEETEEDDDDETSSFEEVSRPAQRNSIPVRSEPPKASPAAAASASPSKFTSAASQQHTPVKSNPITRESNFTSTAASRTPAAAAGGSSSPSSGVESSLDQIKQLIENQTKIINAQNDKISHLVSEMEGLKRKVGSGSGSQDQSERIRQLELELEEARS